LRGRIEINFLWKYKSEICLLKNVVGDYA
jgi:hypothetical protein